MARWRFPSRTPIRWASTRIWRLVRSNAEECFFFLVLNRGNLWVNHGKPYGKAIFHRDGGECTVRICQNGILWHSDISTVICRMQFLESFLRNWSWFNAWALAAFHLLHLIDLGNKNGPKNGKHHRMVISMRNMMVKPIQTLNVGIQSNYQWYV